MQDPDSIGRPEESYGKPTKNVVVTRMENRDTQMTKGSREV